MYLAFLCVFVVAYIASDLVMSVDKSTQKAVELHPVTLTETLSQSLDDYDFSIEQEYDVMLEDIQISDITRHGATLSGVYHTGRSGGFPNEDSYAQAKKIENLLKHHTCVTGETEGSPVWFENAAWCNNCHSLLKSEDEYIGEVICPDCNADFTTEVMRATVPVALVFIEEVTFSSPVKSGEEAVEALRDEIL